MVFLVVMDCPPIRHDDRIFGDEEAFVPTILSIVMIVSEFIHWSPSKQFLTSDGIR